MLTDRAHAPLTQILTWEGLAGATRPRGLPTDYQVVHTRFCVAVERHADEGATHRAVHHAATSRRLLLPTNDHLADVRSPRKYSP
jgi:hypothetical protein